MTINLSLPITHELKPKITVVGVGGAGGNAVNNMITSHLEGVEFVSCNTDAQSLAACLTDRKVQLGNTITHGLGAGARPEVGRAAAEEALDEILDQLSGSHMVFITAGMGGGTGTGAAPVIARAVREQGILTVAVVTKPFQFEGAHRMRLAEAGLNELQQYVDTLIVIPNQNLFRLANERTTFADAFQMADQVLHMGVRGVTDLMVMPGLINLDFADIRTVMSEMGKAMMGTGEAEGETRAIDAAEAAISNPLLDDVSMRGARGVLINITGGLDMTLYEVDAAANRIREEVDGDANIIFGSTFDNSLAGPDAGLGGRDRHRSAARPGDHGPGGDAGAGGGSSRARPRACSGSSRRASAVRRCPSRRQPRPAARRPVEPARPCTCARLQRTAMSRRRPSRSQLPPRPTMLPPRQWPSGRRAQRGAEREPVLPRQGVRVHPRRRERPIERHPPRLSDRGARPTWVPGGARRHDGRDRRHPVLPARARARRWLNLNVTLKLTAVTIRKDIVTCGARHPLRSGWRAFLFSASCCRDGNGPSRGRGQAAGGGTRRNRKRASPKFLHVRQQRTLRHVIGCAGVGLHSGARVGLTLCPAAESSGIRFRRVDRPGAAPIAASLAMSAAPIPRPAWAALPAACG